MNLPENWFSDDKIQEDFDANRNIMLFCMIWMSDSEICGGYEFEEVFSYFLR